jgi:LPPG:FO 2-phospho-L-lactate transferase
VGVSGIERCVVLAGGTGGAKLAAGVQDLLGAGLSVVANTADDVEIAAVDVSPDPDLITYWLTGEIDEQRGWGIKGDSFTVFDRLVHLGIPDWFRLSDRDLATCLYRREFVDEGGRRTDAQAQIARALGAQAAVLPMCEERVKTEVRTADGWRGLQQYLVAEHAQAEVHEIQIEGIAEAAPTPEVLEAISSADAILIGPSNPVISIGPIISMPAVRQALASAGAPVVAVSPYVAGQVVKGPTDLFMRAIGRPSTAAGVASLYEGLIDGMVCDSEDPDPAPEDTAVMSCPTLMEGREGRRALAETTLEFASTLGRPK